MKNLKLKLYWHVDNNIIRKIRRHASIYVNYQIDEYLCNIIEAEIDWKILINMQNGLDNEES